MTTFDDLLEEAGNFGRFQKRIFAMMCMVSMPWAGVYVGTVFQGFTPDHWCRDPAVEERRQACGWSLAESRRLTVPLVNGSGLSSCEQYEVDWNATELTCDTQELDLGQTPTGACKDGWEYDYKGRQSFVTEVNKQCCLFVFLTLFFFLAKVQWNPCEECVQLLLLQSDDQYNRPIDGCHVYAWVGRGWAQLRMNSGSLPVWSGKNWLDSMFYIVCVIQKRNQQFIFQGESHALWNHVLVEEIRRRKKCLVYPHYLRIENAEGNVLISVFIYLFVCVLLA